MKKKILILVVLFALGIAGYVWAKNYNAYARAQDPSGNWVPVNVTAGGALKIS